MPKEDAQAQIETAFADTPAPGDEFGDISATQWDEGVVEYFKGRTWRGHKVKDLRRHEAALSFFTHKAFRYWLPAFMLAELENPDEADVIAPGITFHLTDADNADNAEERLRQFPQDELAAIAAFFNECAERYDGHGSNKYREAERAVRAHM